MTDHFAEGPAGAGSGRSMGHVALHYGEPAEGPLAARLLSTIGLVETQMLPLPGGNFYRFVVEGRHFARGDGIVYLSALPEPQRKLVDAIHAAFAVGTDNEHDVVKDWREMMTADPEASILLAIAWNSRVAARSARPAALYAWLFVSIATAGHSAW